MNDSNNELLHDIAGVDREEFKTNNQLLKEIAESGGGGGSALATYDAVIPGDYATLELALAAGKTNIFLKPGTHTVSSSVTVAPVTTITGVRGLSVIELGNNGITFTLMATLRDLVINADNGYIRTDAASSAFDSCKFTKSVTGTGSILRVNGDYSVLSNVDFTKLNPTRSSSLVEIWKSYCVLDTNHFEFRDMGNTISTAGLSLTGSPYTARIVGNKFTTNGNDPLSSDAVFIGMTHADGQIESNQFENLLMGGVAIMCDDYDEVITGNRFYNIANVFVASNGSEQYRRTYNISDNLLLQSVLNLTNIRVSTVSNNYISSTSPMTWTGVEGIQAFGNQIRNCGLTLDATSSKNQITGNTLFSVNGSFANTITDNGSDNIITPNMDGLTIA